MNNSSMRPTVDWNAYSQKYDMLLAYNPYYQQAHQQIIAAVREWEVPANAQLADIGAGTGNYSVAMAQLFPQAQVIHIDNNKTMNAIAPKKASDLINFEVRHTGIQELTFPERSLHGVLCLNALYTFPEPVQVLQQIYRWMAPGGQAIFLDPGRIMNIMGWKLAISWHLLRRYGLQKTLEVFQESKVVAKQNAYIRSMQQNGTYWTHSHEDFCRTIEQAGFTIESASVCFRGDCDLVMARKTSPALAKLP